MFAATVDSGRSVAGDRFAKDSDIVVTFPYRLCVGQCYTDVVDGRAFEMDSLGSVSKFYAAYGDNDIHGDIDILGGAGECGEYEKKSESVLSLFIK